MLMGVFVQFLCSNTVINSYTRIVSLFCTWILICDTSFELVSLSENIAGVDEVKSFCVVVTQEDSFDFSISSCLSARSSRFIPEEISGGTVRWVLLHPESQATPRIIRKKTNIFPFHSSRGMYLCDFSIRFKMNDSKYLYQIRNYALQL